jgi:hypothetical protein
MDRDALEVMDVHPLVRGDIDATMLLAELFLAKTGYAGPLCEHPCPRAPSVPVDIPVAGMLSPV